MLKTSARLLRLLSLLQSRMDWSGEELAERLGVTGRTVRSDIEKLRDLGYPVTAAPGVGGGYRLGAGAKLPPLLLDDDEAVAIVVGLRTSVGGGVSGMAEASVRALAKFEQVLPPRLRHQVSGMGSAIAAVPSAGPTVDPDTLSVIAATIRAGERLRFDYETHRNTPGRREVEPHQLVNWGRRWYLVGWDIERADWRTFRVDRISPRTPNGPRFTPRPLPDDAATHVQRGVGQSTWRYTARVLVHASMEYVRERMPHVGAVEPAGPDRCVAEVGSDTAQMLALYLGLLDVDFDVIEGAELKARLRDLSARFGRAAAADAPDADS
ncbi:helix-turn-helix transcriptional regulator [Nocardia fusca]|uniref:helix-turn-helix transcriptional regulator n=1 Tax=Nocardia fusca TaxID=941183 RepID=UPI0037C6F017